MNSEKSELQRRLASLEGDLTAAQTQVTSLKCAVAEMSAAQEQKNAQIEVLKVLFAHFSAFCVDEFD